MPVMGYEENKDDDDDDGDDYRRLDIGSHPIHLSIPHVSTLY
jgi:hypothetical protein